MKMKIMKCWVVIAILMTNSIWITNNVSANSNQQIKTLETTVQNNDSVKVSTNNNHIKWEISNWSNLKRNNQKINWKKRHRLISLNHSIKKLKREIEKQNEKWNLDKVNSFQQELWELEAKRDLIRSKNK